MMGIRFATTLTIAKNTFRETVRDRVFFGIVAFALSYIVLTIFLGKLSLGDLLMIRSFGLAGVYIFGLLVTIFLGSSLLSKEIERRTLYFVLAKPASRSDVVLGKFIGLFGAVFVTIVVMAVVYLAVVWYQGGGVDLPGLAAIGLEVIELGLFVALLIMLSAVVAPLTATICSLMILFVGHLLDSALQQAQLLDAPTRAVVQGFYYILPNLEKFNIRNIVVHGGMLSSTVFFEVAAYGFLYMAFLLVLASWLFEKREL